MKLTRDHIGASASTLAEIEKYWFTYFNTIKTLLEQDDKVHVTAPFESNILQPDSTEPKDDSEEQPYLSAEDYYCINIDSSDYTQLLAFKQIFGTEHTHNEFTLKIKYTHGGKDLDLSSWETAFRDNPFFINTVNMKGKVFTVWTPDLISFYNNNPNTHDGYLQMMIPDAVNLITEGNTDAIPSIQK